MTRRALLSVTDKTGVVEFARQLVDLGFAVLSTGGTFRALRAGGVPSQEVSDYTGFPEMMDGRLKTLHPKVHGGLLGRRGDPTHAAAMREHGIDPIDVLAVNLYRFRDDPSIEQIDIGGPAMLRSAAKNWREVVVVIDPADYQGVALALREGGGKASDELRERLAGKAFRHTAAYDIAIAEWFDRQREQWALLGHKVMELRYGENPHQQAAFYRLEGAHGPSLAHARQLSGRELSYNNLLDLDAALGLAGEFAEPACVIVKHNNPCGTAVARAQTDAFGAALQGDPQSAYGGILALNRALLPATARAIVASGTFVEAIVAPDVSGEALAELQRAKWGATVRVLALGGWPVRPPAFVARQVAGGFLLQTPDVSPDFEPKVVTRRAPSDQELTALRFLWQVCKHVKSNAIVLGGQAGEGTLATTGVGAGQMSRVDSVKIAVKKAGARSRGSALASDAFFPFADGLEAAAAAGVTAVIQPGGSKRDAEVIAAADQAGIAMLFTGVRHFRH
jgi:phosphoribosylaminoimidazolecarboxamide formyltransferase/IMP cyclohydrolase